MSVHIAALVLGVSSLPLGDCCEQMIVLRGPGDQVASEGYELVGVAVQERVAVASPFHPDLRV